MFGIGALSFHTFLATFAFLRAPRLPRNQELRASAGE
jgi:hypothetical protein